MKYYYDTIADEFEPLENSYNVKTRLRIIYDELLDGVPITGKSILDPVCGYCAFTTAALDLGAEVVSVDIAFKLVKQAQSRSPLKGLVSGACNLGLDDEVFDVVISSEMLEHADCERDSFCSLVWVLNPGGFLVITTPNKIWEWLVHLASRLKLRPFQGIENFLQWGEIEQLCDDNYMEIIEHWGFHPWPFQIGFLHPLSRMVDLWLGKTYFGRFMINQA